MGAGVTVADINQDGFEDIILNDSSTDHRDILYINNQNGKFIDKTLEYGLTKNLPSKGHSKIIAFDCNNDGYPDLLIQADSPILLKNVEGKYFENITAKSGLGDSQSHVVTSGNAFDYDKDGNLDLIWGSYFKNDPYYQGVNSDGLLPDNFSEFKKSQFNFFKKGRWSMSFYRSNKATSC